MIAIAVILVAFCIFMAFRSAAKEKERQKNSKEKLEENGLSITKKIRDLAIDEVNKKWMNLSAKVPSIHSFSDIISIEINENGEKYKSQHGIMCAVVGGATFGLAGALVGSGTANKAKEISHLSVDVYMNNLDCPMESFVFINSPTKTSGVLYQKAYETVKQMAATLTAMQNIGKKEVEAAG